MSVNGEQQPLIAGSIPQAFHHSDHFGDSEPHPAVFSRHRHPQYAKACALPPVLTAEFFFAVAANDIFAQFGLGKLDRAILKLLMLI